MNVWLVNPFDPLPSQDRLRYSFLVRALADAGYKVTWWTSRFAHWGKRFITETEIDQENRELAPNAQLIAKWTTPYRKHVGLGRVVNHVIWACMVYVAANRSKEIPDIIFCSSTPLLAASLALRLARKNNAVAVLDVVDLWPEAFEIALPARIKRFGRLLFAPLMALETVNFRRARAITAVSETYRAHAIGRSSLKPSMVVPYGIDLDTWPSAPFAKVRDQTSPVRVCYAGTFGTHHDVDTLIQAAHLLKSESDIEILIAGDGPHREKLIALANSLCVTNVKFLGWMPVTPLRELLMTCDIGVIAVSKGSIISFPLKTYEYLAAGLALVHSVPGELDCLVRNHKLGLMYLIGDPFSLAATIRDLVKDRQGLREMRKRSRELVEQEFHRRLIHERLMAFLVSLVEKSYPGCN